MRTILLLCVLMCGCVSHEVRCDSRLRPINAPAARVAAGAGGTVSTGEAAASVGQ